MSPKLPNENYWLSILKADKSNVTFVSIKLFPTLIRLIFKHFPTLKPYDFKLFPTF